MAPAAAVRVSWPKRASKVPTDTTEDTLRELALPRGGVDVKVCAVSDVCSGPKLVGRKERRGQPTCGVSRCLPMCFATRPLSGCSTARHACLAALRVRSNPPLDHTMNFRTLSIAAALIGVASIAAAAEGASAPASAASAVKHAAHKTAHAVSKGASEAATGTEHVASEVATGTAHAAHKAASGVKHAAHKAASAASDAVTK